MVRLDGDFTTTLEGTAKVSLFADDQSDITDGMEIIGLPEYYWGKLEPGSTALTAAGEVGFLKSDGTWNWL